ncbi:ABC transporter permease subunit [Deferrisoma palaeochoriense]
MTGRPVFALAGWALRQVASGLLVLLGTTLLLYGVLRAAPTVAPAKRIGVVEGPAAGVAGLPGYGEWLLGALRGDLGRSAAVQQGRPVVALILPGLRRSLGLAGAALAVSTLLAVTVSRWARRRFLGRLAGTLAHLASALPVFLLVYAITVLGNRLVAAGAQGGWWDLPSWFPFPSRDHWVPWVVAVVVLAVGDGLLADLLGRIRAEVRAAGRVEHRVGARLLGIPEAAVTVRETLPGVAAHLSRRVAFVLGSTVILEAALGWPGLGYLTWRAAAERDLPLLLGSAVALAAVVRLAGVVAEAAGRWADPRVGEVER